MVLAGRYRYVEAVQVAEVVGDRVRLALGRPLPGSHTEKYFASG